MLYGGLGTTSLAWRHFAGKAYLLKGISFHSLRMTLGRWIRFPIYSVPESLLDAATVNLPTLMIASLANPTEAGYLLLANRVACIPVGLLGSSLSRVYLTEVHEKMKTGELQSFTHNIMGNLARTGILPFFLLGTLSPIIFPYVFGVDWGRAGTMAAWLAPSMFLQFIVSPVSTLLHATNSNRRAFFVQGTGFILITGTIIFASRVAPSRIFEFYAMASIAYYFIYLAVVLLTLNRAQKTSLDETKTRNTH